jgi:hypothetical protein
LFGTRSFAGALVVEPRAASPSEVQYAAAYD